MVGFVLGPFIFAACMFGMVTQVSVHESCIRITCAGQTHAGCKWLLLWHLSTSPSCCMHHCCVTSAP
jgi:hypothetical protein